MPQLAVVHVDDAFPDDAARVDVQGIPLLDGVVGHGREQHMGRRDGVEIAGKVQVDVFHGDDLGVAAACSAAFDAEAGSQGRFAQGDDGLLTDFGEALGQADGGRGFAFAGGVGVMAVTRTSLPGFR